jgi:hypothetical protein
MSDAVTLMASDIPAPGPLEAPPPGPAPTHPMPDPYTPHPRPAEPPPLEEPGSPAPAEAPVTDPAPFPIPPPLRAAAESTIV